MYQILAEFLFDRWLLIAYRAIAILGPMFLIFWVWKPNWLEKFRIPQIREHRTLTFSEIIRTTYSLSVYLFPVALILVATFMFHHSVVYTNISDRGWPYFFFSLFVYIFVFDTWFYWLHRAMHANKILGWFHSTHHKSVNTTPLTAYSFGFVEAILIMLPYIPLTLFVPWHPSMLIIFSIIGIGYNGYVHLGYDFGYAYRRKHPILKWFNSATHHSTHHQLYTGNFSNYFTFWDKLMGTEVEDPRIWEVRK